MEHSQKRVRKRAREVIRNPSPEERAAVDGALRSTAQLPDGAWRVRAVRLTLIDRSHTVDGAALDCHISPRTVRRWNEQFLLTVAKNLNWV